jgi:hypothetical protein
MRHQARHPLALVVIATLAVAGTEALTQAVAPTNSAPNPYRTIEGWAKMPRWAHLGLDRGGRH